MQLDQECLLVVSGGRAEKCELVLQAQAVHLDACHAGSEAQILARCTAVLGNSGVEKLQT